MLIVHEVMGRHCGWLTAATAQAYREWLGRPRVVAGASAWTRRGWDVHGVYVPEAVVRPRRPRPRGCETVMDEIGAVNIFVSEGAGLETIVAEIEASRRGARARPVRSRQDRQDQPGRLVREQFAELLGAEKTMVQKSGYFCPVRAGQRARPRADRTVTTLAVDCALRGEPGVIGHDEERGDELRAIEFERIKGGKPFDLDQDWYTTMLAGIGQPVTAAAPAH